MGDTEEEDIRRRDLEAELKIGYPAWNKEDKPKVIQRDTVNWAGR